VKLDEVVGNRGTIVTIFDKRGHCRAIAGVAYRDSKIASQTGEFRACHRAALHQPPK
jgi:hypothetical protein